MFGFQRGVIVVAALLLSAGVSANTERPPVVVVFDVEDKGAGLPAELLDRLGDYLSSKLAATGAFEIVPRDQVRAKLLEQKKKSYKFCYDQSCQIELGRELAAEKSLSTKVILLGSKCTVTCSLFDLRKSAASVGATADGGCTEDEIVASIEVVVDRLAKAYGGKPQLPEVKQPVEPPESVEIRFRSDPAGAEVLLNEESRGETPLKLLLDQGEKYKLVVHKDGYQRVEKPVAFSGKQELSFTLEDDIAWQNALATETELIGVKLMTGITPDGKGTIGGLASVYTMKWKYLNLTCLEFGGGYGGEGAISFGLVGARPAFPIYFGNRGQHQVRLGLGLGYGGMTIAPRSQDAAGFALWPTVSYTYQTMGQIYLGATLQTLIIPGYFDSHILDGGDAVLFSAAFEIGWTGLPD
jgi:hypothetical protein